MDNETQYQLLTIEEMRELAQSDEYYVPKSELEFDDGDELDEKYTRHIYWRRPNLLRDHLLLEECIKNRFSINWRYTTNVYDPRAIAYMIYLWYHPLVWIPIPDELKKSSIIAGRVAEERYVPRSSRLVRCTPLDSDFIGPILKWFAAKLPKFGDKLYEDKARQTRVEDIILWRYITANPRECYTQARKRDGVFDPSLIKPFDFRTFYDNILYIAKLFDGEKAAEIVRLLRRDWKRITSMKFFGIDKMTAEQIEDFRAGLFEGMDYYLERWEAETPQQTDSKTKPATFEFITDLCRKEGKVEAVEAELCAASKGTAVAMWKIIRINEALGYLSTKDVSAAKIYKALTAYFGELPYNERNFRDARNKR